MIKGRELLQEGWTVIDSTDDEMLEAWMLFCIAVAGKTAKTVTKKINFFLRDDFRNGLSPFAYVRMLKSEGILREALKYAKIGQYNKLVRTFDVVSALNPTELRTWTPEQFELIHGIGPKTSRFFIQSTRENTRYAVLDTHVLAWMREQGINAPKSTPSKKDYAKFEALFLDLADQLGYSPRDLDETIWLSRARI